MKLALPAAALTATLVVPAQVASQDAMPDTLSLARQYTMWLYESEADSLVAYSNERARASFSNVETWTQRVLDPQGRIEAIGIGPAGNAPPIEQEHC